MKYVLGLDIGGTKSAILLARPDKEHVVFLERKAIPTHGTWKEVLGCLADMGKAFLEIHRISREECCIGIFLTFGTGLGAGLILNGRLYEGACGMAGEAGHVRLAEEGPVGYAEAGSFEGFCSGGGIARLAGAMAEDALKAGRPVSYLNEGGLEGITARDVAEAADMGYADARNVLAVSGRYFGRGLALLVDILNPERIVAGGIYARAGRFLKEEMEKEFRREALPASVNACCILPSGLGEQIGDYGAVMAAMEIWEE